LNTSQAPFLHNEEPRRTERYFWSNEFAFDDGEFNDQPIYFYVLEEAIEKLRVLYRERRHINDKDGYEKFCQMALKLIDRDEFFDYEGIEISRSCESWWYRHSEVRDLDKYVKEFIWVSGYSVKNGQA
jgi:hypothetical protein